MDSKRQIAADAPVYPKYTPVPEIIKEGDPLYEGPRVAHVSESGQETVVPSVPYEWWVDAHGNAVSLVVSTNRNPKEREARYGELERDRRLYLGWKPFTHFASDAERERYQAELKARQAARSQGYTDAAKSPAELWGEQSGRALERTLNAMTQRILAAEGGPRQVSNAEVSEDDYGSTPELDALDGAPVNADAEIGEPAPQPTKGRKAR